VSATVNITNNSIFFAAATGVRREAPGLEVPGLMNHIRWESTETGASNNAIELELHMLDSILA